MSRTMAGRCKRLRFEVLQRREMLDGNVTAVLKHGELIIRGDDKANEVAVFQLDTTFTDADGSHSKGDYVVLGGTGGATGAAATSSTTVNGKPYQIFPASQIRRGAVHDLVLKMAGGDDAVGLGDLNALKASTNSAAAVQDLLGALVSGMVPAGVLTIRDGLKVRGGTGNDAIGLQGVNARHAEIDTGSASGEEQVGVFGGSVGKELSIHTGTGSDAVTVSGVASPARRVRISTGDGNDTVRLSNNSDLARNVRISTGEGNDTVDVASTTIDRELAVNLGAGNDTFDALSGNNVVKRRTRVDGGGGTNTFSVPAPDTNQWGRLSQRHFPT